ncbi:hypothetical protein [Clostridium sp. KNHs214]|uniref:hypothetical protein n=1 Tax=Clostridium sp. KNHs214 TaxID=1540257 RepID=UPI000557AC02|nr:hypothetical protein [Clostridium sp. KNHs214]
MSSKENKRDFQTWIYLGGDEGVDDALYFHTENPGCDFPCWLDNIEWDVEIPHILIGILDLSKFHIGMLKKMYIHISFKKKD